MENINFEQIRQDLEKNNLLEIQKELTNTRRTRTAIMSLLVAALLSTIAYGLLETPFIYTLSNIGNLFPYRVFFIIWSIITGISIQFTVIVLFKLEKYKTKYGYTFIALSVAFLIITAFIPALVDKYYILWIIHTATAALHAIFLFLAVVPFSRWVSKENPRLRRYIYIWQVIIYIGSFSMLIIFEKGGMFELWFFVSNILYFLYLSLVLFEETIIKKSVKLLFKEDNLNIAIEKYFVNLDSEIQKNESRLSKLNKKPSNQSKDKT